MGILTSQTTRCISAANPLRTKDVKFTSQSNTFFQDRILTTRGKSAAHAPWPAAREALIMASEPAPSLPPTHCIRPVDGACQQRRDLHHALLQSRQPPQARPDRGRQTVLAHPLPQAVTSRHSQQRRASVRTGHASSSQHLGFSSPHSLVALIGTSTSHREFINHPSPKAPAGCQSWMALQVLHAARPDLRITVLEASVSPSGGCWLGG
ncbi:hypothetical protein A4X06_0g9136 [Tilletia controversa]|uniref:Uncharacterized protein n=1 Tax=Tilletia controversa TaxID=13291 RepID=A0A8X7MJL2_9BASI|nr:hypothetical protein A4X06_0g9136 [Tilletia controversa]